MGSSTRPASSIDTPVQHAEHVYSVAQGDTPAIGIEEVSASWRRSATEHGVDPLHNEAPRILSPHELKDFREPVDELICSAQDEIDRLYKVVREAGYTLLFCDTAGVAVEHRGDDADASRFRYWGTWLGGVWSEVIEGTNGIGTCIAEERPVTVHRSQHFRSRHINLSCSGAPVFDVDGRLIAVLDVSAIDPQLSERAHALTGALTVTAARAITERFFRERFRREWIVAVAPPEDGEPGMLLAVDGNQRIVGGNRAARTSLLLDDQRLRTGVSLWSLFERDPGLFRRRDLTDVATRLMIAGSNETWPALVTPPESILGAWRNPASAALHTRPRLDLLASLRQLAPAPQARGGLAPGTMRRVREYVDAHLGESMDLAELATIAGLSVFHFARQFKQSVGATPHHYLVQRRVERAELSPNFGDGLKDQAAAWA
jgi:GAF domain-containing protein